MRQRIRDRSAVSNDRTGQGRCQLEAWAASSTPPSRPWIPTFLTVGNAICNPERREIFLNQLSLSPSGLFLVTKRALPQERSFHPSSSLMGAVFGATGGWNCRVCLLPFQAPNSPDRPEHGGSRRMAPFQSKTTFGVQRSSHEPVPDRS